MKETLFKITLSPPLLCVHMVQIIAVLSKNGSAVFDALRQVFQTLYVLKIMCSGEIPLDLRHYKFIAD